MAEKMRFTEAMLKRNPNLSKFSHYYNIQKAVGSGCPNIRNDVLLIQFMLKTWANTRDSGLISDGGFNYYDSLVPMHGNCDFPTMSFLIMFQMRNSSAGKVNARFEPMTLHQMDAVNSYLAALNLSIWSNRPNIFKDFSAAPGIPNELVPLLKG